MISVREPEDLFFCATWRDRHAKYIIMTLLNTNREFFWEYEILCGTLALIYIFSPFYLRVMLDEYKIYSYIQSGFTWYSSYTLSAPNSPLINRGPPHISKCDVLYLNFWRELCASLPSFCIILCLYQASFIQWTKWIVFS